MQVSVFLDQRSHTDYSSVNRMYSLKNFNKIHTPQFTYTVDNDTSLYIVGGRKSIQKYCEKHPFLILTHTGNKPVMSIRRGVPGLSKQEMASRTDAEDIQLAKSVNAYKHKTVCLVQISAMNATRDALYMKINDSTCIYEMIKILEASYLNVKLSADLGIGGGFGNTITSIDEHNRKYAGRIASKFNWV